MPKSDKLMQYGFLQTNPEITIENLPISGSLPDWLQGTLIRNGPGKSTIGPQQFRHWFDGYAMLHKFSFENGRVDYAGKFLETFVHQTAEAAGRITYTEFATDPCRSLFARATTVFNQQVGDNAKVSIAAFAERMIALAETPIQVEFDVDTLKSVGVFNYEDHLVGQMTTAHPHFDEGAMFNVVTRFGAIPHYHAYRVDQQMQRHRIGAMRTMKPAYMHSFGMSENYIIVTEFPLVVNPLSLLFWLKPFIENYHWEPQRGTPFHVINRHTGELVGRYECDPFFAFHHVNAFERGDDLIVDLVAYDDASIVTEYFLNRLSASGQELPHGRMTRFTVPLKGKRVRRETLSDTCIELPHLDYARYNMNPDYHYVYGMGIHPQHKQGFYNQLVKINVQTGRTDIWHEAGCYPGEPIFVPVPDRHAEDHGVLLSVVLDIDNDRSFLLVLDAQTLQEIARATLPHPLMIGFHGIYLPGQRSDNDTTSD
jgi:carotenoid cleavage dioxygenase-like enzyme